MRGSTFPALADYLKLTMERATTQASILRLGGEKGCSAVLVHRNKANKEIQNNNNILPLRNEDVGLEPW